jgi:5,10-methylenetetrahydrofolate reductase
MNHQPLPYCVDFAAGCAYAPKLNLKNQTQWLKEKVKAGAEFIFSQPFFSVQDYESTQEEIRKHNMEHIPFFAGVMPIVSLRQAEFLQSNKIPGIVISEELTAVLGKFNSPDDQLRAGMDFAIELALRLARLSYGLYLIMPFNKKSFALTSTILKAITAC